MTNDGDTNVIGFPPEGNPGVNRRLATRWGRQDSLFARGEGWVGVPDAFLRHYATLQPYALTASEAMFVLQLMSYKWGDAAPFPSYKKIAIRMGISDKMTRRYASALEAKGYLKRTSRIGSTNTFDLSDLFTALATAVEKQRRIA
jgi:Helix-turn-helix domain